MYYLTELDIIVFRILINHLEKEVFHSRNRTGNIFITMKILVFTLIVLLGSFSFAQKASKKKAVQTSLAIAYSHKRLYRGALIWDAPLVAMGPSFTFYNTLSLGKGGLSIFKNWKRAHKLTLGILPFDDNEPNGPVIKLKKVQEDFKNQRASTFGAYLKYDYRYKKYISISLSYHQDLKRHKGSYFESKISTSVIPFVSLGIGADSGDAASNQFAYGPEGVSGLGHGQAFINVMLPFLPGKGVLMLNFSRSQIIQTENTQADFVRGRKTNHNISTVAFWNF